MFAPPLCAPENTHGPRKPLTLPELAPMHGSWNRLTAFCQGWRIFGALTFHMPFHTRLSASSDVSPAVRLSSLHVRMTVSYQRP